MSIEPHALLAELLLPYEPTLEKNFAGYRNHCHRVLGFALALLPDASDDTKRKLAIATAFHDIGLWTANTVDYLPPSVEAARAYVKKLGVDDWADEIADLVNFHHKVTPYRGPFALAETFRKADLADFSMGLIRSGISKNLRDELRQRFPNAGFHKMLLVRAVQWIGRHPLNPIPIVKW